jgi:predicted MFS family arabinose efflux permease
MILYFLFEAYGWKWTMRLHAALLLNALALAWLMYTSPNSPSNQIQQNKSGCQQLSDNFKGMWRLFTHNLNFFLKMSAQFFYWVTFFTMVIHTPSRAITLGIEIKWAAFLMTLAGFCSLGAR